MTPQNWTARQVEKLGTKLGRWRTAIRRLNAELGQLRTEGARLRTLLPCTQGDDQ